MINNALRKTLTSDIIKLTIPGSWEEENYVKITSSHGQWTSPFAEVKYHPFP